jgi:hypothetical protein
MYDRFTCHHVTCDCRTCQRDRRHLCDVPDRAGGAGLRARLRVAHRQGITHVPITALAIFWLTFAFWRSSSCSMFGVRVNVRMFMVSRIDGSGNSLKKRQRTTVGNVTPLQSTVDLPTPAGAASEKATRRERGPARQCVPVDSTESFEIVPVTLWSLCRAPGLLGLLSVGGVSVVLCLSVARIQCAREERERGYGHRLESPCVRPPYARRGHLLEGSGR